MVDRCFKPKDVLFFVILTIGAVLAVEFSILSTLRADIRLL